MQHLITIILIGLFATSNPINIEDMGFLDWFKTKRKVEHKNIEIKYDLSDSNSEELIEIEVGNINLPTGKIIASDPYFTYDTKPFSRTVKPGSYPVKLYIIEVEPNHYRIAFAKIKFVEESSSYWTLAITDDMKIEDLKDLKDDEYFGFSVDAGLGCFIDEKTNLKFIKEIDNFYKENPKGNFYFDLLAKEFDTRSSGSKYLKDGCDWNNHVVDKETGVNVLMFSSGWGDGFYPTYWGHNSSKEIVELTIDFMIDLDE
ncbi:DUF4241 domain-containing protein [Puteibacter caeruleilacunae]|nr:DUF4241 domain-containing protein [Puteibacter caeruleilacunae]